MLGNSSLTPSGPFLSPSAAIITSWDLHNHSCLVTTSSAPSLPSLHPSHGHEHLSCQNAHGFLWPVNTYCLSCHSWHPIVQCPFILPSAALPSCPQFPSSHLLKSYPSFSAMKSSRIPLAYCSSTPISHIRGFTQLWCVCALTQELLSCPRNLCSTQSAACLPKLPNCTCACRHQLFPIYQTIRCLYLILPCQDVASCFLFAFLENSITPITLSAWEERCLLLPESSDSTGDNLHSPTVSCASATHLLLSFLVCFCSVQRKLLHYLQGTAPSCYVFFVCLFVLMFQTLKNSSF